MELGANIRKLRQAKGLTQVQMAEALGVVQQLITRYEQGVAYPSIQKLIEIGKILGVTPNQLLGIGEPLKTEPNRLFHGNSRMARIQEIFAKLPSNEQRAFLKLIEGYTAHTGQGRREAKAPSKKPANKKAAR